MSAHLAALALLIFSGATEERPDSPARPAESDLFGASPARDETAPPASAPSLQPREDRGESGPPVTERRLLQRLGETENPLSIGGQLYLRSILAATERDAPSRWQLTAPSLVDAFLDARPSDRVRGFVLGRMFYDATLDPNAPGLLGSPAPANPDVLLDQLWLRFDAEKTLFLTVGKQHVKWGTARFWNPTDYLHAVRRDPLDVFDARTGTTMVRMHVPWERRGWNFYAIAILEPLTTRTGNPVDAITTSDGSAVSPSVPQGAPTSEAGTVGGVGGAARAEVVLGPSELAAGAVLQRGHKPRFALEGSVGLWEVDVYAEAAVKTGSEVPLWRPRTGITADTPLLARYETYEPSGLTPAVTAGLRWSHKYSDEDQLEAGLEYFFNRTGYDDPSIYPWLVLNGAFTPFYVGRHYAAAYLSLPRPGAWNQTTFVLSTIGNFSDRSFVTRLDHSVLLLTHLRLETFAQVHYAASGASGGEFRLGFAVPPGQIRGFPGVVRNPSVFDLGLALRISL